MKRTIVALTALSISGFWIHSRIEVKHQSDSFRHELNQIAARPALNTSDSMQASTLPPLQAESLGHTEINEARVAYEKIRFQDGRSVELFQNLSTLARGLQSEKSVVRHTTEDLVRHLLSRWVLSQPSSHWHQIREIDDFFKVYAQTENTILRSYLKTFRNSPEAQYLSQL